MKPIFLHGLWRCGSTYFWNCFRRLDNSYCYYEPLNHGLDRITSNRINGQAQDNFTLNSHPNIGKPYFDEFKPFLKRSGRGICDFSPKFETHHFILEPQEKHAALKRYIETLLDYEGLEKKVPVLGFNRTSLRLGWLVKNFSAFNLYINRDPYDIWHSYNKYLQKGNYTFFTAWLTIIEHNRHHPLFVPLAKRLNLRGYSDKIFQKRKRYYRKVLQSMSAEETYFMVYYVWALSLAHAQESDIAIFDMSRHADTTYVNGILDTITTETSLTIDLGDINVTFGPVGLVKDKTGIEQEVLDTIKACKYYKLFTDLSIPSA